MEDKSNIDFRKLVGIDILTAHRVLMKKGITTNDIEDEAVKLFRNMIESVENRNLDDDYKILLHLVLTYYLFTGGIKVYDEWIKKEAAESNMKPEKYIKVVFGL